MSAIRRLIVEVCDAHNLMAKDGEGSSSPYVSVDFDGQNMRSTTKPKALNPQWNEKLEFVVNNPQSMSAQVLHVNVYNDKKNTNDRRGNFLGRVKIYGISFAKQGEEALVYFPLEKRSIFSNIRGEIGLKIYYVDEEIADQKEPKAEESTGKEQELQSSPSEAKAEEKEEKEVKEKDKEMGKKDKDGDDSPVENVPAEDEEVQAASKLLTGKLTISTNYDGGVNMLKDFNPSIERGRSGRYGLVEPMQYLYVRVIKARELPARDAEGSRDAYVKLTIGSHGIRTRTVKNDLNPQWDEVFAIEKEKLNASAIEIAVWHEDAARNDEFLGAVGFDVHELPTREPPDGPLAPHWYTLAQSLSIPGDAVQAQGQIMVAAWLGTQADEAFQQAWQSDTGGLATHTRSKVYLSPRLWYLRVNLVEAHDLHCEEKSHYPEVAVKAQLGFQLLRTRFSPIQSSSSTVWNEDLIFVCAEPFEEALALRVVDRVGPDRDEIIGEANISLNSLERRIEDAPVSPRWFNLERAVKDGDIGKNKPSYAGRIHVRACLEGGYHVMDEPAHLCSDVNPTAKQLWRPSVGVLQIGILGAKGLMPMKSKNGRRSADAYCVAKYGNKWVRSRTVFDSCNPKWNEQYAWEVYDHCTVLTLAVFDNSLIDNHRDPDVKGSNPGPAEDRPMGKVRIRISSLEAERIYAHSYPLLVLNPTGVKKMGEIELAFRFSCYSMAGILNLYATPMLPKMHYLHPFGVGQKDLLRQSAMRIVASRLSRTEPPLRREVVQYVLDAGTQAWSMRRSKANWFRIVNVLSGLSEFSRWVDDIRQWKNPTTSALIHILYVLLLAYPRFILPTVFLSMALMGVRNYRFRARMPAHVDARLSHAHLPLDSDELQEEFDSAATSSRSASDQTIRMRYDRLRSVAGRVQTVVGDVAAQGERLQAALSWRDPRASAIFMVFCVVATLVLYATPFRVLAVACGLYYVRHPRYRDRFPPAPLNFFRRLPTLSDCML